MQILETERLIVRKFTLDDAEFILKLLNEPSFIENIADKNVRTIKDAQNYIITTPQASYEKHGFGLWLVELKEMNIPIGMCGLIKRDFLDVIDVGYAYLPGYFSKGYATESVKGVIKHAVENLGVNKLAAIVNENNSTSIRVLEKNGFIYEKMITMPGESKEVKLFFNNF